MNYKQRTYNELCNEADRLLSQCRKDVKTTTRILENQKREYEETRKPTLRIVYPKE